MARGKVPKITWGASFVNTLEFGYPMDLSVAWSDPRDGHEVVVSPSGVEDSWSLGEVFRLAGRPRWIPTSSGTTPTGVPITGWDGATGWRAFLAWARDKNVFRFFPDRDLGTFISSTLVEPMRDRPGLETADLTRNLELIIQNFTTEYTGY